MALTEKKREKIEKRFEKLHAKQNKHILEAYRLSGDKSILELLQFDTDNADEVSRKFGITVKDAEELIEKKIKEENELKQKYGGNPLAAIDDATKRLYRIAEWVSNIAGDKSERCDEAVEFIAESGSEDPAALAEHLGTTEDEAAALIREVKDRAALKSGHFVWWQTD